MERTKQPGDVKSRAGIAGSPTINVELTGHQFGGSGDYTSKHGDTFKRVCDNMDIAAWWRKAYYKWLGPTFGHRADINNSTDVYFSDPFAKASGTHRFIKTGSKFPFLRGTSWDIIVEERHRRCNANNYEHLNTTKANEELAFEVIKAYATSKETRLSEDPIELTRNILHAYYTELGKVEESWEELIATGVLEKAPKNPETGKITPPKGTERRDPITITCEK